MVSNASPLIYLAQAGQIHLLKDLCHKILVPDEVLQEVCGSPATPDAVVISKAVDDGWILSHEPLGFDVVRLAESAGIERGEAAAIILARNEQALLLIDDKMGRSAAEMLGVSCMGSIGVLLQAFSDSLLQLNGFETVLDKMIDLGFRLDSKVYRVVLRMARDLAP